MNVGQAARGLRVSAKMVGYYESIDLLTAACGAGAGHRQYSDKDVQTLLRFIRRSRDLGFSIDRIRTLLSLWQDQGLQSADVKRLARVYIAGL